MPQEIRQNPNLKLTASKLAVIGEVRAEWREILSPEALQFISDLHQEFDGERKRLLKKRQETAEKIKAGFRPSFNADSSSVRNSEWRVGSVPKDLEDRRVEITGPAEPKMIINALNSGARIFMADLEDSLCPSWENSIEGQRSLAAAVRRTLSFTSPEGKSYSLNSEVAVLKVRPRGWHLDEKHILFQGEPASGSLVDFGLFFFHNVREQLERKTGPYFYLPKLENAEEARLWNQVFIFSQKRIGLPIGTIKVTVLVETILASFELDEILFQLREHIVALNAGRWDYLFSIIKKFYKGENFATPDRSQLTMTVPFMRAYTELLVKTAHRRGAHAIGGMAAFIPSRRDAEVNRVAMAKVKEDKMREAKDGFDGTWVAHPDLVPIAKEVFDSVMGSQPHQKNIKKEDLKIRAESLIDFRVPDGKITETGFRNNINVALTYLESWLRGYGAVAIHNLMEDAATAEISRSQLWLWVRRNAKTDSGQVLDKTFYQKIADEEQQGLIASERTELSSARKVLDHLVLQTDFEEFLTLPAYDHVVRILKG